MVSDYVLCCLSARNLGVIGMFLGVPLFSVIYVLIRDAVNNKIKGGNVSD